MQDTLRDLQKQLEFCCEQNRKATFKTWVFDDSVKCSAAKLAEAGFIYSSAPDCVKCFLCQKTLDSWEEGDDPWYEHKRHAPYCSFANMEKPEKAFTLHEFITIRNELIEKFFRNIIDENIEKSKQDIEEYVQLFNNFK